MKALSARQEPMRPGTHAEPSRPARLAALPDDPVGGPIEPARGPGAADGEPDETDLGPDLGPNLERAWKRGALLAGGIIIGSCLVFLTPLRDLLRVEAIEQMRQWVLSLGLWGPAVFFVATAVLVALGAPRLSLATLGGAAFGWRLGTLLALGATLIACVTTFTLVRAAAGSSLRPRLEGRLAKVGSLLQTRGVLTTTLLRVVPVGSCHAMNIMMALGPVSRRDFAWGTLFGIFPLTVSFALLGSGMTHGMLPHLLAAGIGIAALTGSSILAMRRSRLKVLSQPAASGPARENETA